MKLLTFTSTIFLGLFSSCNSTNSKITSNTTLQSLSNPKTLNLLKNKKRNIDTLFAQNTKKLIVLVKLADQDELAIVNNGDFPENVETTFNILKDSLGHIIRISEFPFSESGDWDITFSHYYDENGKTFAFERKTNFFNSVCTDGVAFETKTEFYDINFKSINKIYNLIDEKKQDLRNKNCELPYDYEYKVSADIDQYLKKNKIKNSR